ncbi:hypothetical protein FZC74_13905 [Sutcliffiella horikoshii]|uniref:Uncharacterized protein n=1 Tax=Sutcliffiella horikoshii TaxID=79883 RepID=A0AA94WR20_9BACI|nr:hypothetical protein [Sutcliffiella horikoshii]TYS58084.1 hypothetical protein FZC74_13905 [Sutcliffiella horikoshii]
MSKIKIRVQDTITEIEKNERYYIEVEGRTFIGTILENMDFDYDGRVFFYILTEEENEDYQIVEDEIKKIKKL